jgi:hypothetical protein
MSLAFREKLAHYGLWTYRGAWALEITAALIGLATGLTLGYQAVLNAGPNSVTSVDLALASAPFFMVAIAELTKIPIATLLFSVRWLWKPIVFLFLLALAGITFETVFMGLERAATLRQLKYEDVVNQLKTLEFEREQISSRISDARGNDALRKARDDFELISQQAEQERAKLELQVKEIEKELEGARVILPGAARIRDSLAEKNTQLTQLNSERNASIREAVAEFERQRESYVERIKNARDREIERRYQTELAALVNPRRRIETQFQPKVQALETEISSLRAQFDKLQANAPALPPAQRQALTLRRDEAREQANQIMTAWGEKLKTAREQIEEGQRSESEKAKVVQTDQARKDQISEMIKTLEANRIEFARTDQIRRIAARVYGERPEAVSEDQAGFISVLWFGSIALLAALAGPLTAVVALALQRTSPEVPAEGKLQRLIRKMLLVWRWKRTRSVQVPVEVTVEKEVEKRIEVPVERVIKEILYVPVFTDDPEALKKSLAESLPKDVAELVAVNFGRPRNVSAA